MNIMSQPGSAYALGTAVTVTPPPSPLMQKDKVAAATKSDKDKKDGTGEYGQPDHGIPQNEVTAKSPQQLTPEEQKAVQDLAQRDREVRAHEAAHKGAAGPYALGGTHFDLQRGPDGHLYATGGEVHIDTSNPGDPAEALRKAQVIQRAALAPAKPSTQDRAVAAQAVQMAADARIELQKSHGEQADSTRTYREIAKNGLEEQNFLHLTA